MRRQIHRAAEYMTREGLGPYIVRSLAGTGAVRIGAMIATFLVGVQLARGLGPAGYGYYGIALSIVTLAGVPGEMGIPPLITREVAAADARGRPGHLFGVLRWGRKVAAGLSLTMALAVIAGALVLQQLRPSPLVAALLVAAPVIPFIALAKVDGGALRGLEHIVRGQLPAFLLKPAAMSLLLFLMFVLDLKQEPWIATGLNSATAALAWILAAVWLKRRLPAGRNVEAVHEGRRWLSSMVPMALAQGMQVLQGQMSILLLGILAAPAEVGLFRIAMATAVMLSAPQAIIVTVAGPTISRLYAKDDKRRLQMLLTRCAQAQFASVLLLSASLLIAPAPILSLVYGSEFAAAGDVLRIILVGQLITIGFGLNATVLNMTRFERRVTRALAIALVLNAATLAIFVPLWGMLAAAAGYVVSMLAWNIATWRDARRLAGVDTSFLPLRVGPPEA